MARRGVSQHSFTSGLFTAAPTASAGAPQQAAGSGLVPLGLGGQRDGLLYVPAAYSAANPAPFILTLHGAGGDAQGASTDSAPAQRQATIMHSVASALH
jgi:poly(3-hydroxybutyrate) depolymerase